MSGARLKLISCGCQALLPYQTWIGIPDFPLHTPEPLVLAKGIERVLKNMTAQGMQTSTHFFGAHSLGGVMIQVMHHTIVAQ